MALPLAPIAFTALRYGAVVAVAYAAARRVNLSQTDQSVEDSLDKVAEGLAAHRRKDAPQANGSARWKRTVRVGGDGPGFEIDVTALGRIKIKRV